jgi:hypothetical protein
VAFSTWLDTVNPSGEAELCATSTVARSFCGVA